MPAQLAAIPMDRLQPSKQNPRQQLTDLDDLAASIKAQGLIQPVIVQRIPGEQKFTILAGHRRVAALQKLGAGKVPCIVREDLLPDEELAAMLVENGQRANLDPIEEAIALAKLHDQGKSHKEIGQMIGRSDAHVSSRIALLRLPLAEREEVRAKQMPVTVAVAKAREAAPPRLRKDGTARPKATAQGWHFGPAHPLANQAKARCARVKHPKGKRKVSGGIACGPCWEATIRADAAA